MSQLRHLVSRTSQQILDLGVADFHGSPLERFIIIRSHEYDGDGEASVCKVMREFNTATLAKLNIDNEADRIGRHRKSRNFLAET